MNTDLRKIDVARVRGLLFDVDGTLSDTDDRLVDRIARFLAPASWLFKDKDPQRFSRWAVMSIESPANFVYGLADILGIDSLVSNIYSWLNVKRKSKKHYQDKFWIIPGVKEMLEVLSQQFPMAIVSARDADSTALFLEHFQLTQYFKTVVTAQTCKRTKPLPDPVLYAAEQLGLLPEECVMIGDTIVDVRAGKAAGAQTIAVLCGFGTENELLSAGADLVLTSTADLLDNHLRK